MKKLSLPLITTAVFLFFRFIVLFRFTELDTGFILRERAIMQGVYNLGFIALLVALYFLAKSNAFQEELQGKNCFYTGKAGIVPVFIAAVGLGVCAALSLLTRFRFAATLGVLGIVGVFVMILIAPVAITGKAPKGGADSVMMLFLVCFGLNGVMCIFLNNNTISTIPQNYFSLLAGLFFILALFYEAKKRAGLTSTKEYFAVNLLAAVFITAVEIPTVVACFMEFFPQAISKTTPMDIALVAFVPYLWCNLFAVVKNCSGTKEAVAAEQKKMTETE